MDNVGRMKIIRGLSLRERYSRIAFLGMVMIVLVITAICLINAIKWIDKPFPGFLVNYRLVMQDIGQESWTGKQAGLRYPDKILKADNRIISSVSVLEDVINNTGVGTPINYTIERNNQIVELTIPVMRFTVFDFLLAFGSFLFVGIVYLAIAVVVFILKPDTNVSWAHFLLCILLGMFNITMVDVIAIHYGLDRFNLFAHTFFPAAGLHLCLIFPERKRFIQRYPYLQFIPYIISIIFVVPFEIFYPGPMFLKMQILVLLYMNISAIVLFATFLISYFKASSILARQRARVILFGTALAFPIPGIAYFLSLFYEIHILGATMDKFLHIPILIFPASIAYAISRHNLFDVDVFIKRAIGYVIMTIVVGAAYFGIQTSLSTFVLRPVMGDSAEKVYPLIFALLVVFLFNPLNRRVQDLVDKLFYRKKFDYKDAITSISDKLKSMLSQNEIIMQLINTVRKDMFVDTAGVIMLDSKNKSCQTLFIDDESDKVKDQTRDVTVAYDDPLLALVSSEKKLITKYEIAEDRRYSEVKEACGKRFLELDASLAIPLIYQDEVKGIFALGHKKSGHFYSRDDIDLLETLANQGTVAIENARLFEENLVKGRMEEELKIGHDIQMNMLPEKAPEMEGFKIAARSIPAREVGGDFYDFIEIKSSGTDDGLAMVIADVSGKGVSAGLIMAASRSTYRALAAEHSSVEKIMNLGNQRLSNDIKKGMFVALLYAVLSPKDKTLTFSSAGQTLPIICSEGKSKPAYITTEGDSFPQGIVPDCKYLEKQVALKKGDTVVFYTDGVVEAMDEKKEMYGFERLMTAIDEGRELDANSLLEKLMDDITNFVGGAEAHDDITVIVLKVE